MSKVNAEKVVTTDLIAEVVGCSKETVKKVRSGKRNADTDLGQSIQISEMLLKEGFTKLVDEVKRVIKF